MPIMTGQESVECLGHLSITV